MRFEFLGFFGFRLDGNHDIFVLGFQLGVDAFDDCFEGIDFVLDVVAELEGRHHAFFDHDGFASARVAGRTRLAGLAAKGAETANFDGIAFDQLFPNKVEELLDDGFNIVAHKSGGLGDFLNQGLFSNIRHAVNIGMSMS